MTGRVHEPVDGVDVLIHVTTKSRELGIFPLKQCRGRGIVVEEGHSDKEGAARDFCFPRRVIRNTKAACTFRIAKCSALRDVFCPLDV
jgi:hypothetical protein